MLACRFVAATADAFLELFVGPRGGVCFGGDSFVSPSAEKWDSWVIDIFQVRGKVGTPSKVGDEGFPGGLFGE